MTIRRLEVAELPSNQEAVDALNKKLGTKFTVFDYKAWENGQNSSGSQIFNEAVEKYLNDKPWSRIALKLSKLFARLRSKFR